MTRHPRLALGIAGALALALSACGERRISDDSISESVASRLKAEQELAAYDLAVETEDGIVTLEGAVSAPDQRLEAERIARSTAGVQGVSNQIQVGGSIAPPPVGAPGAERPDDPDMGEPE